MLNNIQPNINMIIMKKTKKIVQLVIMRRQKMIDSCIFISNYYFIYWNYNLLELFLGFVELNKVLLNLKL